MEKLPRSDYDDPSSLTSFNIIVEGEGEGLISKIFSKFKTAVTGPQQQQQQQLTSPSSSTQTISIVLSNETGGVIDQDSFITTSTAENQKSTPTSAIHISGEGKGTSPLSATVTAGTNVAGSSPSTSLHITAIPMPTKSNNESSSTVTMTTAIVEKTASSSNDNKLKRIPTSTSSVATITENSLQNKNNGDSATPISISNSKKAPSTASGSLAASQNTPTASSFNKSTNIMTNTKHIIIDEDQNQHQEISYPPIIPLKRTSSVDSDTQSVMTTFSVSNTNSLSRILNRLRGGESVDNSNKDFWMPDEQCRECFDCNAPFNLFRRKHHCRTCGRIFCSKCLGNSIHTNQILRVCNDCYLKFESYKADDTISIQDGYGYTSSSMIDLSASSTTTSSQLLSQQQLQQKTYLLPNDDEDSSDDEFERSTNSLEIQRPNIDLHFSQSTSSQHHTTNDIVANDVGIKKLLTNTFLRSTPRSRTSTMNSLGIDTSLAVLEGTRQQNQQQQNSPMPFRRNSFIAASNTSAHPDNNPVQNTQNHHSHSHSISISNNNNGNGSNTPTQAEYYEDDDSKSRWDKNPRNLLNFLGGERPSSGLFNNFFFEDYAPTPDSPSTSTVTPVQSTSTSTTRASWYMRPPSNNNGNSLERSNSLARRRLSLTEGGSNTNSGNNNLLNSPTSTTSTTRHHRVRTKSLMRNTPITTASIMMETTNQSSANSSGNESCGSMNNYGTSPANTSNSNNGGANVNNNATNIAGMTVARCPTPDLDHLRSQILSVSATTTHPVTVATHEQWDESFLYLMRNILRHLLVECGVKTKTHQAWEDMTMKLLLTIADEVQPHIRVKDTFNMNHYVKIKKLPGGLPKDSFSVSGVVMSKNVCHKDMIRKIENPRILILNFDLDGFGSISNSSSLSTTTVGGGANNGYNNGFGGANDSYGGGGPRQEYLKFDRLLAWERDHMNALVDQIVGLKPSIVLIAANVSRTVIERLNKAKIVVAYNIKKQKLDAIARCADATVFNYKNELWNAKSVPPGKCGMFETLTVMHEFLPNRRKTFLMFTQCPKERGATIVLRGGDLNTLYIIKFIMKFMVTVVNNINLEAQLRKDFIELRRWNMPIYDDMSFDDEDENGLGNSNEDDSSTLLQYSSTRGGGSGGRPTTSSSFVDGNSVDMQQVDAQSISAISMAESQMTVNTVDVAAAKKKAQQQFHHDTIIVEDDDICLTAINTVLKKYQNTILSISPGVTLPAPHILLKLRDAQKKLIGLIRERLGASITGTTLATSTISPVDNASISSSPQDPNNEKIGDGIAKCTPPAVIPPIPTDLMEMPFYLKAFDVYLEHDLEYRHYQDLHLQAWYIFKKYIDGIHQHLSPIYHQEILVLRTTNPMNNHTIPCEKAVLEPYNYYDPTSDYTLGTYILNATKEAYTKCSSKMCEAKLIQHDKTYSHGNAQIKMQVFYEDDNGDEDHPIEEKIEISRDEYLRKIPIFFRTKCHICKIIHSWKPMSDLLQRYSFGKFLELLFYQSEPIPLYDDEDEMNHGGSDYFVADGVGDDGCPHGLYRDHTISFRIQNLSVNFTHAMVKVVEVHPPPLHLRFSQKQQMAIKDASLDSTRSKIAKFFDSIIERNKAFSYDIVQPNMVDTCKEHLQEMSQEALKNKKNLLQKLQLEYATSAPTDTLQLNNVLAELQNHAVNWDLKYIDFARRFVRPERELRRLTTNHLRKMFPAESLYTSTSSTNSAPVVSNLSLRTKRAIEAADLPLLDVGLDNSPTLAPFGVSGNASNATITDDVCLGGDVTLKEQPGLGESPTESYPWFDELKRFDQMFMQDNRKNEDNNLSTSDCSKKNLYGGAKKNSNDMTDATKSLPSSPGQIMVKGTDLMEAADESRDLDPSVARRLSLELMKDAPKKKKEQVVEDKKQQKQQQQQKQEQRKSLLEHSEIVENKKSPSPPPPSPMSSSAALIVPLAVSPASVSTSASHQSRKKQDEVVPEHDDQSQLIRHAAGLPVMSSTAYKRLAGLLPDPMVGKSKSSPSPGNSNSSGKSTDSQQQQQKHTSLHQKLLENNKNIANNKANNRKTQFYEHSASNLLLDSTPANATTATTAAAATSTPHSQVPSKPNFYRGSPYAASKLQDRSSIAYRYGFMGPPSSNSPPILPVIDKKLGINTHIKNPMIHSNSNSTSLIHPAVAAAAAAVAGPSKSTQQSLTASASQQDPSVVRPRSRTMAIVGGVSTGNLLTYQQNMKTIGTTNANRIIGGGRIPIPSSNFNTTSASTTGSDHSKPITTAAAFSTIKFPGNIGIGASSSGHQQSHLPIPISHHYHHGRKLSEGKIRHIRQRLPSKASLEPYTKIKEIIATHDESSSDEEEDDGISEEDDEEEEEDDEEEEEACNTHDNIEGRSSTLLSEDGDELLPLQHKAFSLMHTDEYDESLGRELVPSILELQQFNREHQLQMSKDTLPYLSVESGMVGESSRKMTHDESSPGSFGDHHLTKTLSRNVIMEAVLRSSNNSSISLDTGSSTTSLDWSPGVGGKNSIMKAITYVLAEKSISNLLPLEYPFSPTEHIFGDSNILVREDEPSSIISYMLGSTFYNEKLHRKREMRMSKATAGASHIFNGGNEKEKVENADQISQQQETKPFFSEMFPETDERERPWKFSFKGGSTSFTCKIYFAEQFDMLRKSCGCDEIFISSLARCTTWDASGGKSGSIFLKTKDERFLIKQISKYEMDAFLGSANKYFLYMFNEVFDKGIPTVLCKIFGLYRIGFYNNVSGKSMKMDILVMENLFYETSVKKVYDLKGSMRNRYAEKTGKDVEVFLDENLVEIISKTPLYMRVDTKYNLSDSLFNDTQFLLSLDVMDYSLLVGFDEDTNEIVVGIVDFIRTFTWDKKLESWVKESGMLGGGKKDPTIVSPKMYRKRFRSAIDLYFCMIPDFWTLSLE